MISILTRIFAWGGAKNHPLKYSNIKTNSSQAVITNTIESTFLCEFFILSLRCVLELSDSAASTGIITIAFVIEAPRSNRDNRLAVISSRRRCHRGTILVPCLVSPPCCRSTCNLFARLHRALPTRRYPQEHIVHLSRQYLTANNSHQRYFKDETSSESIDTLSARQYIFWLMFQQHHHS